jgi:hypothetical protein
MLSRFALLTLCAFAGCAVPVTRTAVRAPNPNGCYAIVYERPLFEGAADVVNGPALLATLTRLRTTNEATWQRRIRSLRVGAAATVRAYADTGFKGHSERFAPATEHPQLDQALSARIQSLEVACVDGGGMRESVSFADASEFCSPARPCRRSPAASGPDSVAGFRPAAIASTCWGSTLVAPQLTHARSRFETEVVPEDLWCSMRR